MFYLPALLTLLVFLTGESRVVRKAREIDEGVQPVKSEKPEDVVDEIKRISQDLPREEWQNFWKKLTGAFTGSPSALQDIIRGNRGNLNKTLQDIRGRLGDRYAEVKENWLSIEQKFKQMTDKLRGIQLKDVWETTRSNFMKLMGNVDLKDPKKTADTIKSRIQGFWDNLTEGMGFPRATETQTTPPPEILGSPF